MEAIESKPVLQAGLEYSHAASCRGVTVIKSNKRNKDFLQQAIKSMYKESQQLFGFRITRKSEFLLFVSFPLIDKLTVYYLHIIN